MNSIPFLSLQEVNARYSSELHTAAQRVIDRGWYLQGQENEQFEQAYAQYIGTKYCVGCANGLDALILILRAYIEMGVMQPGDEIIVPANTYIATILAITENHLVPVLVEPRFDTLQIDDTLIEQHITARTRAILIVHLYGRMAYSDRIGELCRQYHLKLIEDNAQAHGCRFSPALTPRSSLSLTGSLGDAAGHSFYPGKNLGALGDGGAVTTHDQELAHVVRALANYGSQKKYVFKYAGRNSRLDELQAALLNVKLRHLDDDNNHRRQIAAYYYDHIQHPLITLPQRLPDDQCVYHLFPILCDRRDELQRYLTDHGIGTMIHYPIPPHKQECYKTWESLSFPITERIASQELSLPMGPTLTLEQAHTIVELLNAWC